MIIDESLLFSIPLAFVYPFDSCLVLNCLSLVCFHLLGLIGPLFQIWVNFTLFVLIFALIFLGIWVKQFWSLHIYLKVKRELPHDFNVIATYAPCQSTYPRHWANIFSK